MTDERPASPPVYLSSEVGTLERLRKLEAMIETLQRSTSVDVPPGYSPQLPLPAPLVAMSYASTIGRRRWFDWPLIRECRFIASMYLDPRYRLSRIGQFGVPGVLLAAVVNYLILNHLFVYIPFVTQFTERAILLVLGMVLFLILRREAARYRTVLDYLANYRS